jgi:hypothetical protein
MKHNSIDYMYNFKFNVIVGPSIFYLTVHFYHVYKLLFSSLQ